MAKKVSFEKIQKEITKSQNLAKEKGLKTCIVSEPVLKTQNDEKSTPEMMQLTITFTKPTRPRRAVFFS